MCELGDKAPFAGMAPYRGRRRPARQSESVKMAGKMREPTRAV